MRYHLGFGVNDLHWQLALNFKLQHAQVITLDLLGEFALSVPEVFPETAFEAHDCLGFREGIIDFIFAEAGPRHDGRGEPAQLRQSYKARLSLPLVGPLKRVMNLDGGLFLSQSFLHFVSPFLLALAVVDQRLLIE